MVCEASAWAQDNRREPRIGFLYPAGGQQGAVVHVALVGQSLRNVDEVLVSGDGVHATIDRYGGRYTPLDREQREELTARLVAARDALLAETPGAATGWASDESGDVSMEAEAITPDEEQAEVPLPNHPLLDNIEGLTLRELRHVRETFLVWRRRQPQPNPQIVDRVYINVTIDADASPGEYEIRLKAVNGVTNPLRFQVGQLPEIREQEPNESFVWPPLPEAPPLELPLVINGQVLHDDVDRFRFRATQGQQLVVQAHARRLTPYLAAAVPGWCQATLALYDADGNQVAFEDDYAFDPDPVLSYEVPEDGEYEVEIRDAIYRGREDFVYRLSVGELPFITTMFPLGGRAGAESTARIDGWNLGATELPLDTSPEAEGIRQTALLRDGTRSNTVRYAVGALPESGEKEANDTVRSAQPIRLPRIVNGRIGQPGDVDVFRFKGKAGDDVVAEIMARRLHSPLDAVLRLTDESGPVLEWNDDHEDKASGLLTHHADPYLRATLPEDGRYYVHVADVQQNGGNAYAYRLRVGPPQPDFELRVTPSTINVFPGFSEALTVHAIRRDGFDGDIALALKDPPPGYILSGGLLPGQQDSVRVTLTVPSDPSEEHASLHIEGRAEIGGQTIARAAVPSDERVQAFLNRHLVPTHELIAAITGRRRGGPPAWLLEKVPIQIPQGDTVSVRFRVPWFWQSRDFKLELSEPPEGIALHGGEVVGRLLTFSLTADATSQAGLADNLLVEVTMEPWLTPEQQEQGVQKPWISIGMLPAIPFEIAQQ